MHRGSILSMKLLRGYQKGTMVQVMELLPILMMMEISI